MMRTILNKLTLACVALSALGACNGQPEGSAKTKGEVNIYSARHYDADERLYDLFEKETNIRVNRLEMKGDLLLERMKAEGDKSLADVVLLVDAGNFYRADQEGLFQSVLDPKLRAVIPTHLQGKDGHWFGFATRARVIAYDKSNIKPEQVATYEGLADPALRGKICVRPSSNVYNLSLMASFIDLWGPAKAEAWSKGVVANFARPPEGADTDQLKAIAQGVCAVTLVNHYYAVRMQRSSVAQDKEAAAKFALSFPNQSNSGTHVNISGGALAAHAPNKENGLAFLAFLASPEAQAIFAQANDEFPVVAGTKLDNKELSALVGFKPSTTPMVALGENQAEAQKIFDRAGWK